MAKQIQNLRLPLSVGMGVCGLCLNSKDKQQVWEVQCPAYTGKVCVGHMAILTDRQNGNGEVPEATLFDKAS
jgi:hypothetical protein